MGKISTVGMTKKAWQAGRRLGMGGSDSASVLNGNPWQSAVWTYLDKRDLAPPIPVTPNMVTGTYLEDGIRNWFRDNNPELEVVEDKFSRWLNAAEHIRANTDGLINPNTKEPGIFEAKNTNSRYHATWIYDMPIMYYIQVQHYTMAVEDEYRCEYGWIVFCLDGAEFKQIRIERDDEFLGNLRQELDNFWFNHVIPGIPPEPKSVSDILLLHPDVKRDVVKTVDNDDDLNTWAEALQAKEEKKEAATIFDNMKDSLRTLMADASILVNQKNEILATWKTAKDKRLVDTDALKEKHPKIYGKYESIFDGKRFVAENPMLIEEFTKAVPGNRTFLLKPGTKTL